MSGHILYLISDDLPKHTWESHASSDFLSPAFSSVCFLADRCLLSLFCFIASDYLLVDSFSHLIGANVGPAWAVSCLYDSPCRHLQRGCPQNAGTVWRPLPQVTRGLVLSSCSAFLVSRWGHWSRFVAWVHMWDFFFFFPLHPLFVQSNEREGIPTRGFMVLCFSSSWFSSNYYGNENHYRKREKQRGKKKPQGTHALQQLPTVHLWWLGPRPQRKYTSFTAHFPIVDMSLVPSFYTMLSVHRGFNGLFTYIFLEVEFLEEEDS